MRETAGRDNLPPRFHPDRLGDHPLVAQASTLRGGDFGRAPVAVAIPAMNEAERIGRTLEALDGELQPGDAVVVVVNNSQDRSADLARRHLATRRRPFLLIDLAWRGASGSAPLARRLALECAAALSPQAHLLSLDADTLVRPLWRASYEALFAQGFDLVCGGIGFVPEEAALLPEGDPEAERVLREARAASREAEALIDPDPDNPWPHHGNIGGANFGLRAGALERAGGLPHVPSAEDRELLRRARAHGLRVRFAGDPCVWTSPRLGGRARGGLSDELARSRREEDPLVDEALEPAEQLELRIRSRRACRLADAEGRAALLRELELPPGDAEALQGASPGETWLAAEDASPRLRRRRLRRSELARHHPDLVALRDRLRQAAREGRDETLPHAART
ncbi:glycosyltransferase family 2 protein [Aureimonas sp. AU4]|uniref:glycosyltransferase n=1 Tax=Aureimonas sp. AU4 TaxID=1638163 RepID=UPI000785B057|nr:glycosyltransferase family 2 protein [Aureimonas sp. AU4]